MRADLMSALHKLGYTHAKFLAKGMQCLVYDIGDDKIIKVYGSDIGRDNIVRLRSFYDSLNLEDVEFTTPKIIDIRESDEYILVEETKLSGQCPTFDFLRSLDEGVMETFLRHYVNTLFTIKDIKTDLLKETDVLDHSGQFFKNKQYTNWQDLLTFNIEDRYSATQSIFDENVVDIHHKKQTLISSIDSLSVRDPVLIHGDYFPANLMINDDYRITAVLDFGILTTVGDQRFDIATGWAFSDMYDQVKSFKVREYTKKLIFDRLSVEDISAFYSYVLAYSFISANMYKKNDPHDGHFTWCIANLNNEKYWAAI